MDVTVAMFVVRRSIARLESDYIVNNRPFQVPQQIAGTAADHIGLEIAKIARSETAARIDLSHMDSCFVLDSSPKCLALASSHHILAAVLVIFDVVALV